MEQACAIRDAVAVSREPMGLGPSRVGCVVALAPRDDRRYEFQLSRRL